MLTPSRFTLIFLIFDRLLYFARNENHWVFSIWDVISWIDTWKKAVIYSVLAVVLFAQPHRIWLATLSGIPRSVKARKLIAQRTTLIKHLEWVPKQILQLFIRVIWFHLFHLHGSIDGVISFVYFELHPVNLSLLQFRFNYFLCSLSSLKYLISFS